MGTFMTPKESEFYDRFIKDMAKVNENQNLGFGSRIEEWVEQQPEKVAVYFQDETWTWRALNEECNKIANYFSDLGAKPGDTVSLMLENTPEYLFLSTGLNKIRVISALTNFNQKKQALIHSFKLVNPKYIVVDGDCLPSFQKVVDALPIKSNHVFVINNEEDIPHDFMDLSNELKSASIKNPTPPVDSVMDETALYIYTSGTTGLPKAVIVPNLKMFTQGLFLGVSIAQLSPDDVIYIATPFYHNLSIGCAWLAAVLSGASTAIRKRFSTSQFWKDIQKYRATFMMYVGEIPRYLLNQPEYEHEKNTTLNKMVGLGLRKDIWERFKARFKVEHIWEFYGLTEGSLSLMNVDEVPGMIGRNNMAGLSLAKVNPETGEFYKNEKGTCIKCKDPGEVGMALIKIDKRSMFRGYSDKEKTQKKILNDVFRKNDTFFNTGDMLQLNDDAYISFYDRFGDTFRWKGENVSTLEVESILTSHPAIYLAAVYGVAIPNTEGKAGMASVKLNPSMKFDLEKDFSKFVIEVLPKYAIPIFLRIRDELELAGPYKIKKTNLFKEAYDLEKIQDPLFFWDSKKYVPLTDEKYKKIIAGTLKI